MINGIVPSSVSAREYKAAFVALRRALPTAAPRAPKQSYALSDLQAAFIALKGPLAGAKEQGGLINPWTLAGLGHDEVRNAAALAGIWMTEFGGETSRRFLGCYLSEAVPDVTWGEELDHGYRVETEVCPLGDAADRVDLVIETRRFLVGIEVKIRAGLGQQQLERYVASISRRAELQKLTPKLVLLAPFQSPLPMVSSTSWAQIVRAARGAAGGPIDRQTFVQQLILSFGEHVRSFRSA